MTANNDQFGYSQYNRDGNPDFDCSSLVIIAWKQAGVPLTCSWTGDMYVDMVQKGFADVTDGVDLNTGEGLLRSDVLIAHNSIRQHTEMYCGNGLMVGARSDENGDIFGYIPGDQDGHEIAISPYLNKNWDYVLRYMGGDSPVEDEVKYEFIFKDVYFGCVGSHVNLLQRLLKIEGFYDGAVDSKCEELTVDAIRRFQQHKIDQGVDVGSGEADEWCGISTWRQLLCID